MSDHVIKVPPLRAGRRVRWTFEVSAAAGGKDTVRTKASKKPAAAKANRSRPKRQAARTAAIRPAVIRPAVARPTMARQEDPVSMPPAATSVPPVPRGADSAKPRSAAAKWMTGSYALVVPALAALLLAVLVVPRHSALAQAPAAAGAKPEALEASIAHEPAAQPIPAASAVAPARVTPIAAPVIRADAAPAGELKKAPTKAVQNPAAPPSAPVATTPSLVDTQEPKLLDAKPASAEPLAAGAPIAAVPATESAVALSTVTITGCLEMSPNDDRFRLTDTDGASAPRSRSWKTGFLKKRPAAVNLVGDVNAAALEHQVGKRVAVNGVQTERDLSVRSVRVVAASCD